MKDKRIAKLEEQVRTLEEKIIERKRQNKPESLSASQISLQDKLCKVQAQVAQNDIDVQSLQQTIAQNESKIRELTDALQRAEETHRDELENLARKYEQEAQDLRYELTLQQTAMQQSYCTEIDNVAQQEQKKRQLLSSRSDLYQDLFSQLAQQADTYLRDAQNSIGVFE